MVVFDKSPIMRQVDNYQNLGQPSGCPNLLILLEPVEGFEPPTRSLQIFFSTLAEYG